MLRRVALWLGIVFVGLGLLAGAALYVVPRTQWGREKIRALVVDALNSTFAGRVAIGAIEGPLLTGATIRDVAITDSAGAPFLKVAQLRATWALGDLWRKKVVLRDVLVVRPDVVLDRPPGGRWNWDRILFPDTTTSPRGEGRQWGDHVTLFDVRIRDAHVLVRSPYEVEGASARERDSLLAAAVNGETRAVVVRAPGGYQRVTALERVDASLPFMRIKEPGFTKQRYEIGTAAGIVKPFQPPAMTLRDARGVVELAEDSLWFSGIRAVLPASEARLDGTYHLENGNLVLRGAAPVLRTDDVRFLAPQLPTGGTGSIGTIATRIAGDTLAVVLDRLALALDGARVAGRAGFGFIGDLVVFDSTRVRIDGLTTATIRTLLPDTTTQLPKEGTLSGDVALDGPLTGVAVDAALRFVDRRAGPVGLVARGVAGVDGDVYLARDLRLVARPVPVTFASPALAPLGGTLGAVATVNGRTDGWLDTRLAVTHDVGRLHSAVAGRARVSTAGREPRVDVALDIAPLSLAAVGRFAPALGLHSSARGRLTVRGPLSDLAVATRLDADTAGGIALAGTVGLPDRGLPRADLRLTFDSLDLRRVLDTAKVPATTLVGYALVDGRGASAATAEGRAELHLRATDIDRIRFDTLGGVLRARDGLLVVDTVNAWIARTSFSVGGAFGLRPGRTGDLYVRAEIDSLSRFAAYLPTDTGLVAPTQAVIDRAVARQRADSLRIAEATSVERLARGLPPVATRVTPPPPVRRDSIAGAVLATARLRGHLEDVSAVVDATASDLSVGGNVARRVFLGMDVEHYGTRRTTAAARLVVNEANAAGYQLDSLGAIVRYGWRDGRLRDGEGTLGLNANLLDSTRVGFDGRLSLDGTDVVAIVDTTWLDLPTSQWASRQRWRGAWTDGRLTIDSLLLETAGDARLGLDAAIDTAGRANATFVLRNTQVRDLADLAQARAPADGRVSLDLYVEGTAADPRMQFLGAVRDVVWQGDSLPDARLRFTYAQQAMQAYGELRPVGGEPTLRATATIPIDLALTGATERFLDRPLVADIRMDSLDLGELPEVSDAVTDLKGFATGQVQVKGTLPDALRFDGALSLRDGGAFVVPVELTVDPILADLRLLGDSIVVDSIAARTGDGWTRVTGGVSVRRASNPVFDLAVVSRNARFFDGKMGRMRGYADLTMTGPYRDARIEGSVRIRNGYYYVPEGQKSVSVLNADDPAVFAAVDSATAVERGLVSPPSDFVRGLKMQVTARVDRDVWVRGNALNVEVFTDGEVIASVNPATGQVTLDGIVSTERGQYEFLGKRFNVVRGSATFLPEVPATNPLMQAIAEVNVRQPGAQALAIRLNIGGTLERPRLSLESDAQPPIPQSDLITYLAFGRNTGTLLSQEGGALTGAGASGGLVGSIGALASSQLSAFAFGLALDQLEGNVSRWLGADVLNITSVEAPPELWRSSIGQVGTFITQFTEVEYGRYFGTRSYVGVNVRPAFFAIDPAGTRPVPGLRWEYRYSRDYRFETTFGPRFVVQNVSLLPQAPTSLTAFGVFIAREWKW